MKAEAVDPLMLLPPRNPGSWDKAAWKVLRNPEVYVCVEFGQETETTVDNWNRLVTPAFAITAKAEHASTPAGYTHTLTCNGRSAQVPYAGSREDCLIAVLALYAVGRPDIDLRLCKDSVGNSDLWFLPLEPTDWKALETKYSPPLVDGRFERLPNTLSEFIKAFTSLQAVQSAY